MRAIMRRLGALTALAWTPLLLACQTTPSNAVPAVLADADAQSLKRVTAILAKAMGQASVQLGPGGPVETSTISVLPPPLGQNGHGPLNRHSLAKPTYFDMKMSGHKCYLVRRNTGEIYPLEDIRCRAFDG